MRGRIRGLILPGLLAAAALVILIGLGNWQMRRLQWKEALIAQAAERPTMPPAELPPSAAWPTLAVADLQYRPFRLAGRFLHDREALVFTSLAGPRGRFGGPGYWIVTPLALESGGTVLVNRGFAPQERARPDERGETPTSGPVRVTGLLRPDETPNLFTPDDRPDANIFFARNVAALSAAKSLPSPVAPFTIDLVAAETPPGGLPQAGETRMQFTNNHFGYAMTWYGLAAALLAVFASFVWTRLHDGPRARA